MLSVHITKCRSFHAQVFKLNILWPASLYTTTRGQTQSTYTRSLAICLHVKYEPPRYLNGVSLPHNSDVCRCFSTSPFCFHKEPNKPSSKVESAVQNIKKDIECKEDKPKPPKKSLGQRIKDELIHYRDGFKLLGVEIKISTKLLFRMLKGESLTRREHRLLVTTIGDIFRMLPFIVFIIVPFLEFTLPIFLKFFPNMLPSTFESKNQRDQKYQKHLKAKIEVAKFFQETLNQMAPQCGERHSELAKEFSQFFAKIRTSGEMATSEEIMKFSKLFEDEITLDSLQRPHLVALCRVLNVSTIGTSAMLRYNLRMKLRYLAADDKMIAKEGIDSLNLNELQQACKARGMRVHGVAEERLRKELCNWLKLSLNEKVPQSLLLLSRVLMVPYNFSTPDKLKVSISALPEQVVTRTKAAIGEKEGKVDFKAKAEAIKMEVAKIKEENREMVEEEEEERLKEILKRDKEEIRDQAPVIDPLLTKNLKDTAPTIEVDTKTSDSLSSKDIKAIEDAIQNIAKKKNSLVLEKESLQGLKTGMSDYSQDVKELQDITATGKTDVKVTKGAKRLYLAVNTMIRKLDKVLAELESQERELRRSLAGGDTAQADPDKRQERLVKVDELMNSVKSLRDVPDEAKLKLIQDVLGRLDSDFDGQLRVEDVLKMVEMIANEHVKLSKKQIAELIELLDKEGVLAEERKKQKAADKRDTNSPKKSLFDLIREAQARKDKNKK